MPIEPITHLEKSIAGTVEPVTHLEKSIAGAVEPLTHLEKVIDQYGGGGRPPSGTISITENGTYNVAEYAEAEVNVAGSAFEHHQFVHAEDWFSDSNGSARAFYKTYLAQLYEGKSNGFGVATITNNTATQYAASYSFRDFRHTNKTAWCRSNGVSNSMQDIGSDGVSFYISAGSQIDIYIFSE